MDLDRDVWLMEHHFNIQGSVNCFCKLLGSHTSKLRIGLRLWVTDVYRRDREWMEFLWFLSWVRTRQKMGVRSSKYLRSV